MFSFSRFKTIFKQMEASLWIAVCLLVIGVWNSLPFGGKFEVMGSNIYLFTIAFILLLRKIWVYKIEINAVDDYLETILSHEGVALRKSKLKCQTLLNLRKNIDLQNKKNLLMKEQYTDYINTIEVKNEELIQQTKLLFHNSKMTSLGEMSGSIAHEINNPLMIMKGSVGRLSKLLIREGEYSDQIEVFLERLNRMVERVSSIIYVMQNFSDSCDDGEKEFVPVKEIISSIVNLNAEKLKSQKINIDCSISNINLQAKVNRSDIEQALTSIIHNGSEAILKNKMKEGCISLKVVSDEGGLFIIVRNNGEALDSKLASKIFEPFYSSKTKGIGMGLSIAHTLCLRNNVDLSLDCLDPVTFRLNFLGAIKV